MKEPGIDEIGNNGILREQEGNRDFTGQTLTENHRKGSNLFHPIEFDLVGVFSEEHSGWPECVGETRNRNLVAPGSRDHEVAAANHQWSPDHEHGRLTHPDVFQRKRIEEHEEHARAEQH